MAGRRPGSWTPVDSAMVQLVRAVLAPTWSPTKAAAELAPVISGRTVVLSRLRSRVERAAVEHPSAVAERALQTLAVLETNRLGPAQTARSW